MRGALQGDARRRVLLYGGVQRQRAARSLHRDRERLAGLAAISRPVVASPIVIRRHLGGVISQSFGATEQTFPSRRAMARLRGAYVAAARSGATPDQLAGVS